MAQSHLPLLLVFIFACALAGLILVLSNLLGPKRMTVVKGAPFESGNAASAPAFDRFNVKFYLVAILFLVFDIEAVFIYPWAVVFRDSTEGRGSLSPFVAVLEMATFVLIVLVGLTYAWRKGALEWSGRPEPLQAPTAAGATVGAYTPYASATGGGAERRL
jgi:NADH-quinone oxidoreductase subunit A